MWKLHLLLKSNKQDNVLEFLQGLTPKMFIDALKIMFGRVPEKGMSTHFLKGLQESDYFSFEELVRKFK